MREMILCIGVHFNVMYVGDEKRPFIPPSTNIRRESVLIPTVIYDDAITTRAGSPLGGGNGSGANGVNPANLFED